MLYLLGSVVCSSYLTLSFKVLQRFEISVFQAIVFNYLTCVVTGSIVQGNFPINAASPGLPWFKWALVMGAAFIVLFNLMGFTTQKIGVAVASVANKLSLIIPFAFSLYLYNEQAGWTKILGIIIALVAVFFTCLPPKRDAALTHKGASSGLLFLLPVLLFAGSGLLDTLVKYVEQTYLDDSNSNAFLILSFGTAGALGLLILIILVGTGKQAFDPRSIVAGILIGIPNYFSIWFLVRVL
ncbi:MAG TPA: hypothetical protein VEY06_06055, partial [Flavisolibacter sp.]|nr:hypothetical protein [Flavisolibacter sp.]